MAIKGSLESLGLEDLLQAPLAADGPGRLTLRQGALYAALYVSEEGVHVLEPDLLTPGDVVEAFRSRGLVDDTVVVEARARELSGARLLDHLLAEGSVPQEEYLEVLAASAEDTVLDLMLWERGQFRFDVQPMDAAPSGLQGRLCVDPAGVMERALARIDHRARIAKALGVHSILFLPVAGELPALESPDDPLHIVYARMDGRALVHEIALNMGIGRFQVLQVVRRLVGAGLARPATVEELIRAANERVEARQFVAARALCLQWAEVASEEPGPLVKLAGIADSAGSRQAELDALCALGHLHVRLGNATEGVSVFARAMRRAPADEVVLTGLRMAAEAAGDDAVYADSTLLTAQAALDEGRTEEALDLLDPLLRTHADNVAVHLMRARALVAAERRSDLLEQAEVVGQVLTRAGKRTKEARDAAAFFQQTIAEVAPERGDLLERFRSLNDDRRRLARTAMLVGALAILLAGAGILFWPVSAASLLDDVRQAAEAGDTAEAARLAARLLEEYPDSQEAEEAFRFQRTLTPANPPAPPARSRLTPEFLSECKEREAAFQAALPRLPAAKAQAAVAAFLDLVESDAGKRVRLDLLAPSLDLLRVQARALLDDTLGRIQTLGACGTAHERLRDRPDELEALLARGQAAADAQGRTDLEAAAALLARAVRIREDAALLALTSELTRAVGSLGSACRYYEETVDQARLTLATVRVEAADRQCREEAPKLVVAGSLGEADALYARLEGLVARYRDDPVYASLVERIDRRRLPSLIRDRRAQIADIRLRIAEAESAEGVGDLAGAVTTYAALVHEYWMIRFENLFTLPLRVETVPRGATLSVGGREIGRSPAILRYAWGSDAVITASAEGYASVSHRIDTAPETPGATVTMKLPPRLHWAVRTGPHVEIAPLPLDGHVFVVDRAGHAGFYGREDGDRMWSGDFTSLEGVKSRPAAAGGHIYLARVDGSLLIVDMTDGQRRTELTLPRPVGDLASEDGRVALMTADGTMLGLQGTEVVWRAAPGDSTTAGVLGAHDAFWVGTARGNVFRVVALTGASLSVSVAPRSGSVLGLVATADGVLASMADGGLACLDRKGAVRWKRAGLTDSVGAPAVAAGRVAVVNRSGHVTLFALSDGAPAGTLAIGARPGRGLVGHGDVFLACCDDGRLWACDGATGEVLLDFALGATPRLPPQPLDGERVAVGVGDDGLWVVAVPRAP